MRYPNKNMLCICIIFMDTEKLPHCQSDCESLSLAWSLEQHNK